MLIKEQMRKYKIKMEEISQLEAAESIAFRRLSLLRQNTVSIYCGVWGGASVGGVVGVWPGWEWPCRQALGAGGGVSPALPREPGQEPVADRLGVDSPPQTNDHCPLCFMPYAPLRAVGEICHPLGSSARLQTPALADLGPNHRRLIPQK